MNPDTLNRRRRRTSDTDSSSATPGAAKL